MFVEIVLIQGINDSTELARELAALLRPLPTRASINLLPYNDTGHPLFRPSPMESVEEFREVLMQEGFVATIRTARYGGSWVGRASLKQHPAWRCGLVASLGCSFLLQLLFKKSDLLHTGVYLYELPVAGCGGSKYFEV